MEIIEEQLATKHDLKELELSLKQDLKELEFSLKLDLTLRLGGMLVATLVKLL